MKLLVSVLALISLNSFAAEVVNLPEAECTRKCSLYSYVFQPDALGMCKQVESCSVYSWNDEATQCEVVVKNKLITYPIACRDIPPVF